MTQEACVSQAVSQLLKTASPEMTYISLSQESSSFSNTVMTLSSIMNSLSPGSLSPNHLVKSSALLIATLLPFFFLGKNAAHLLVESSV